MKKGMVSVVVPNLNYAHFLPETIESVIGQTYKNWELIVVDDNSTDNSREVVENYIKKYPQYDIRLFHNKTGPSGTPTPINIGIRNIKGEYFAWLSSDDIFKSDKLEKQVAMMDIHPEVGMLYTRVSTIDDDGRVIADNTLIKPETRVDFFLGLMKKNFINGNTVLIRKRIFDEVGLFIENHPQYPDIWCASEYHFWLRVALASKIMGMTQPLHLARKHEGNRPFNTSGFGERLRGLLFALVVEELDIFQLSAKLSIDIDEIVKVEARVRGELELCGYFGITVARHEALKAKDPRLEEKIIQKMADFTRAEYFVRNAEIHLSRNVEKSMQLIRKGLELDDYTNIKGLYTLAGYEKRTGNTAKALELYNKILEEDHLITSPFITGAHFHLGEMALKAGDREKGAEHFRACLKENPGHGKAAQYLRELGLAEGDKNYWEKGAIDKPFKVIADVDNIKEFEISGTADANLLLRHIGTIDPGTVLDIGCGIGRVMKPLATLAKTVVGVDTAKEMIQKAGEYLRDIDNKELHHVNGCNTTLAARSFDLIYSIIVFMHIPKEAFAGWLMEAGRLLKEDGIFWFQVYGEFAGKETLPQDCRTVDGRVRAYSEKDIRDLAGEYFREIEVFKDPLDRYGGKYWYFCICRSPK
jgi:glycosyltransferase involved in cell wall biosynthesis/predicted TPR repeat methyltransferase